MLDDTTGGNSKDLLDKAKEGDIMDLPNLTNGQCVSVWPQCTSTVAVAVSTWMFSFPSTEEQLVIFGMVKSGRREREGKRE